MEIKYITEPDDIPDYDGTFEAWDYLNQFVNAHLIDRRLMQTEVALEAQSLDLEGFKEALRHVWEKIVEQIKRLINWVKEQTMGVKARLERSRQKAEKVLGELHRLKANQTPMDHVVVALSAQEYRHLAKSPHDKIDVRLLGQAHSDLIRTMGILFESHPDYVKAQMGLVTEAMGQFDVLKADDQMVELKTKLAYLPFRGFAKDETNIKLVGMHELVLNKTTHPGLDELNWISQKMVLTAPTSGFQSPPVSAAIAIMVNTREVITKALQFQDYMLPQLEKLHKQLLHSGGLLMKRVLGIVEGNSDGAHIESVAKELLAIEAKIAAAMIRPIVPSTHWICTTVDSMSTLMERLVEATQHQKAPTLGGFHPALPAPT